jgi:hypothetical protein
VITFNLVMQANADEVRNVATVELADIQWEVALCFEQPNELLDLEELAEIPTAAAVRRLSGTLWRLLDYAADSFPPAPARKINGLPPGQGAALDAGERLSSLVYYLSEYSEATLDIVRKSPVQR